MNDVSSSRRADEWWIKISDFGISKRIEAAAPGASTILRGTPGYIAPEVYGLIKRGAPFASDIWALGQIVFELLTKEMVFEDLGALFQYATQINQFPTRRLSKYTALSVEFITSLMCPIPDDRITATMAISHPWVESKLSPSDPEIDISIHAQKSSGISEMTGTSASWNRKASNSEPNMSLFKKRLPTINSMTESSVSSNFNPSYPAPEVVDVPNNKIGSHGVNIQLWRTFDIKDLGYSVKSQIAFSPNSEWFVIPAGKHARLWNTSDGTAIRTSVGHDTNIRVAVFSQIANI
ncbi:hypothetical protein N7537_005395 [Penicillium hordei]|uniref:Protein kinase domain-containing protein n=1 Tax=Penicillium hordei TaxID=40994 RepID=A0AAD6H487_9EURO|nr:uncharacterized protein N7537_005395 [Penicillium hordei]KAJ5602439.1 hypothetical protein N7537_005395 [Penicillium hordei]